jgi:ribose 1,5-bisphosphokinase PhnN
LIPADFTWQAFQKELGHIRLALLWYNEGSKLITTLETRDFVKTGMLELYNCSPAVLSKMRGMSPS